LTTSFAFDAETLPFLQIWHDLRRGSGILAIEPCTSDRRPDGRSGSERILEPGEKRLYRVEVSVAGEAASIGVGSDVRAVPA
jgi:hypothetical protein